MYLRLDFVSVEIVYVLKKGNDSLLSGGFYLIIYLLLVHLIFQRNFTFLFYISCEF